MEIDHEAWGRYDNTQETDFLWRINTGLSNANGDIAIDIDVSLNGVEMATSTFASGRQVMRRLK